MVSYTAFAKRTAPVLALAIGLAITWGAAPATQPATAPARPTAKATIPLPTVRPTANPILATPKTVAELTNMQKLVEDVVKKCLPATVAIRTSDGEGSGIIISKDGLILTAAHVIEKPNIVVSVVLAGGGPPLRARTLGTDHGNDTGMLKIIKPGEYPFVEVGESGPLKKGEWVVALGHPGGYQPPRPAVARLGRVIVPSVNGTVQLDTDCTLIMGDSGGPLFDLEGHLVGIHSRISVGTDTNMHVPVDAFIKAWTRLARGDDWGPNPMGAAGPSTPMGGNLDVTAVDDEKGVRIDVLGLHSAAAAAGLKVGDIVTKIDGTAVATVQDAHDELDAYLPGEQVKLDVLRDNKPLTLKVTLAPRP